MLFILFTYYLYWIRNSSRWIHICSLGIIWGLLWRQWYMLTYLRSFSNFIGNLANLSVFALFCVIAISKVISEQLPTCDSVNSWWLYSAAPLGNQSASTMTWYPTQAHDPCTEPTNLYPILGAGRYFSWLRNGVGDPGEEVRIPSLP